VVAARDVNRVRAEPALKQAPQTLKRLASMPQCTIARARAPLSHEEIGEVDRPPNPRTEQPSANHDRTAWHTITREWAPLSHAMTGEANKPLGPCAVRPIAFTTTCCT